MTTTEHAPSTEFAQYLAAQRACIEACNHPDFPIGSEENDAAEARAKAACDVVYGAARAVAERPFKTSRDVAELAAIFAEELSIDLDAKPKDLDAYLTRALLRAVFAVGGSEAPAAVKALRQARN